MRLRPLLRTVFMTWVLAAALARATESTTLTSGDGRTMEAIVLGYKKETLRVRRTDTNREFNLGIAQLSADDQARMRKFIADHPELRETIKPSDVRVLFTRKRVAERKVQEEDSESQQSAMSYNVTLTNRTADELGKLRVEYTLFVEDDPDNREKTDDETLAARISRKVAFVEIEPIKSGQTRAFDTVAIKTLETNMYRTWTTGPVGAPFTVRRAANLAGKWKDQEIFGILIKLYDGDRLIETISSSETLSNLTETPLMAEAK